MNKIVQNNQKGFTLVEVLIAVMILAMGLTAAATMQTRAVEQSAFATRTSDCVAVAEQYIEDLITRPVVGSDNDTDPLFTDSSMDGVWQDLPTGYYVPAHQVRFRVLQDTPVQNLATIQVNVVPKVNPDKRDDMMVRLIFVRSMRWN